MLQDESGDEGGGEGQEYCLGQQFRAVPNPCDPSYSHLKEVCMCMSVHCNYWYVYSVKTPPHNWHIQMLHVLYKCILVHLKQWHKNYRGNGGWHPVEFPKLKVSVYLI